MKGFMFTLVLLITAGCGWSRNQSTVSDPLLLSRKPVEAEAIATPPVQYAYSEPKAPLHPYEAALAAKQKSNEKTNTPHSGTLTSTPNDN